MRIFPIRVNIFGVLLRVAIAVWRMIGSLFAGSLSNRLDENRKKSRQIL